MTNNWRWLRLRIGTWIIGGDWFGIVTRLWLIRDRAMQAVTPEGSVVLAECKSLSEALYEPIPGKWTLSLVRNDDALTPEAPE